MKKCSEYLDYVRGIDYADAYAKVADSTKACTQAAIERSMEKARTFGVFDFAVLKMALLSLGLLLGSLFSNFFKKLRFFLLIGFVCSYVYLIWRVFFAEEE